MPSLVHHEINYIEMYVTDMAKAQQFYREAFQWEFTDYGPDYAGIKQGDGECGGFHETDKVKSGGALVILYSNDLEGSVESVKKAGGEISTETFTFPGGRRFHFLDPSGNELAVWSDK